MFSYSGFEPRSVCIHSAMRTVFLLLNTEYVERWIRSITPDLSDNVKKKHSFLIYLVPQYLLFFILNTAWRRIAADIKVKVKRARRLQAI